MSHTSRPGPVAAKAGGLDAKLRYQASRRRSCKAVQNVNLGKAGTIECLPFVDFMCVCVVHFGNFVITRSPVHARLFRRPNHMWNEQPQIRIAKARYTSLGDDDVAEATNLGRTNWAQLGNSGFLQNPAQIPKTTSASAVRLPHVAIQRLATWQNLSLDPALPKGGYSARCRRGIS